MGVCYISITGKGLPNMAKQAKEVETLPAVVTENAVVVLESPKELQPCAIVGINSQIDIAASLLPTEFQGENVETLESGFAPTANWAKPGDFIAGVYTGKKENVGKHKTTLYNFDAKGEPFSLWGSAVLEQTFENAIAKQQLKIGYMCLVVFVGSVPSGKGNDARIFTVKIIKR